MVEPSRTSLYRGFLLGLVAASAVLWTLSGSHGFAWMAVTAAFLLIQADFLARRAMKGLRATRRMTPSAFEEDSVEIELIVENHGVGRVPFVEIVDSFGPDMSKRRILSLPDPLRPGAAVSAHYRGSCLRGWGIHDVGPLEFSTADPMGIRWLTRRAAPPVSFDLFPRVQEVPSLPRPGGRQSLVPQDSASRRTGQSQIFLSSREYRTGDDFRRIHWRASARRGALMVKEHEDDLQPTFTLFLDLHADHRAGTGRRSTRELVVRTAASLLWTAAVQGQFLEILADDGRPISIPAGRGMGHFMTALHELIRIEQQGETHLLDLVDLHIERIAPGSVVAMIFATAVPELASLRELLTRLVARPARPLAIFINDQAFTAVTRWRLRPEAFEKNRAEMEAVLSAHACPHLFLEKVEDLAVELAAFGGRQGATL